MLYAQKYNKNKKRAGELCECGINGNFSQWNTKFPSWFDKWEQHCIEHYIGGSKCNEVKIEEMYYISQNEEGYWKNTYINSKKFLGNKFVPQPIYSYHQKIGKIKFLTLKDMKILLDT